MSNATNTVRGFDRHEILRTHYRAQISSWDWAHIKAETEKRRKDECENERGTDDYYAYFWLGSVYAVMPSGKCYAPWTTNQTRGDVTRDSAFIDALADVAESHGMWLGTPNWADSDQLYVGMTMDFGDEDEFEDD